MKLTLGSEADALYLRLNDAQIVDSERVAYVANCIEKGANFLICRLPAWHSKGRPKLSEQWVRPIYPDFTPVGRHSFKVEHGLTTPPWFTGVFVMRRDEQIFFKF